MNFKIHVIEGKENNTKILFKQSNDSNGLFNLLHTVETKKINYEIII